MSLIRNFILKAANLKPIQHMVCRSKIFKPLVNRFIAGETLQETIIKVERLAKKGFYVTLDYLGENTYTPNEAIAAKNAYIELLQKIHDSHYQNFFNISIKLTQCGLDFNEELAKKSYYEIVEFANQNGIFVCVDMESSVYTEKTLDFVSSIFKDFKNTGTVLQSYLYRTISDADRMIELGIPIRIVKGAYLESKKIAYSKKFYVDKSFIEITKLLLKGGVYTAIATHDETIIKEIKTFVQIEKIEKSQFEFQMLYGISQNTQETLKAEGYKVRIYVPFGNEWYPYFVRRLAERPANTFFILKNLLKK